ncbi:hypothetical protein V1515DRAFT_597995 [Lipomyces mesembrius]
MYQVITSVSTPGAVIRLLHNQDKLYVPYIGSKDEKTDTREEMLEFFERDVDGDRLEPEIGTMSELRNCGVISRWCCRGIFYMQKGCTSRLTGLRSTDP